MNFMVAMLLTCTTFAQVNVRDISKIDYYGVDYSIAKVIGAKETAGQFKTAFDGINQLMVAESNKYNVGKFFKKEEVELLLNPTTTNNNGIDGTQLFTTNRGFKLSEEAIKGLVKNYVLEPKSEVGMVIIAELLQKESNMGNYYVVFFNTQSREILLSRHTSGKARGFGLRNYWAGSIYDVMKEWSYPKTTK